MSISINECAGSAVNDAAGNRPELNGAITFFYYDDLDAAVHWYRDVIGFEPTLVEDWLVLLRISPSHHLGLVDAEGGSQRPIRGSNKGAILSIETDRLEEWHDRLKQTGVDGLSDDFETGCRGRTIEFRVRDPGGYILEFFRWMTPPV